MQLTHVRYFSGPNIVSLQPCAVAIIEISADDELTLSDAVLRHTNRLFDGLPSLGHLPSNRFSCVSPAVFVATAAIGLQRRLGCPVTWWKVGAGSDNTQEVAFEIMRPSAADRIIECAITLFDASRNNSPQAQLVEGFASMRDAMKLNLGSYIRHDRIRTAAALGIEYRVDHGMHYTYVRLGQGMHTRMITPGYTDATSHMAKRLAGRKDDTYAALIAAGLPVARQIVADSADAACTAASKLGYPVVVKPLRGSRGRGVAVNVRDDDTVRQAFHQAITVSPNVVVEQYLQGDDFRLLVINGNFSAAAHRPLPVVFGDGQSTVTALIDQANKHGQRDDIFLNALKIDSEVVRVLKSQDLDLNSVPEVGKRVRVRGSASPESSATDVTDRVHPDNRALAVRAAAACRLDVAGIDFLSSDIAVSWRDNVAGIVEVNAGPGVDMHMFPQLGQAQDVSFRMLRSCIPAHTAGRIPVIMITGRHGKRAVALRTTNLLALLGFRPGLSTPGDTRGSWYGTDDGSEGGTAADIVAMLADRAIDSAVCSVSKRILALDSCPVSFPAVAVITDDAAPDGDVFHDPRLLTLIHDLAVDCAGTAVIVDGTRAALRTAALRRPAWQVGYVWAVGDPDTQSPGSPLAAHLDAGGWAVCLRKSETDTPSVVFRQGTVEHQLVVPGAPFLPADAAACRSLLFAIAAAIAVGTQPRFLLRALAATAQRPLQRSSLSLIPDTTAARACADPRDALALQRLSAYTASAGSRSGSLWLLLPASVWMMELVSGVVSACDGPGTQWCIVGSDSDDIATALVDSGISADRLRQFSTLAIANDVVRELASATDIVTLLSLDESERSDWLSTGVPRPPQTWVQDPSSRHTRWKANELARRLNGYWVSGPSHGWGVDAIGFDDETDVVGKLVAICLTCKSPLDRAYADRIHAAFARGAAGVIARSLPGDLPRWRSLLVCDDIERGVHSFRMETSP